MLRIALFVLFTASVAYADPLEVTVKPASTTWKPMMKVEVTLVVTNTGKTPAKFDVMSCSWEEHWKSSDPDLGWSQWDCDKNAPKAITVAAGKAHEWKLEMVAAQKAKPGAHQLVMTFTPIKGTPTKSKPVTITVAP